MVMQGAVYRFGEFELDPAKRRVVRSAVDVVLRPKVFDVLLYLVEHREVVVTKEDLVSAVWNDAAVTDDVVYRCIIDIRTALADDRKQPRYVRTIPKFGYRFVADVDVAEPGKTPPLDVSSAAPPRRRRWMVAAGALCAAAGVLYAGLARRADPGEPWGELAWWRLDEGSGHRIADSTSAGLHGSVVGDVSWVDGPAGKAVSFPLGDGHIAGADRARVLPRGASPRTVTAWFRSSSTGGENTALFAYGTPGYPSKRYFTLFLSSTGEIGWGFETSVAAVRTSRRLDDGAWHFIAASYSGPEKNVARVYVDGVLDASGSYPEIPDTGDHPAWQIGGETASRTRFRGALDDLRVYARSLFPDEIRALYSCGTRPADVRLPDGRTALLTALWGAPVDRLLVEIGPGAVRNLGKDYAGAQFATPGRDCSIASLRSADIGQDLYIALDVKVPSASAEDFSTAGPYFRSRRAAPGDGVIGGDSAGYWVPVDSSGVVRVRRLNPHEVVAFSQPIAGFDAAAFHRLEIAAQGDTLEVALDGRIITFDQRGAPTTRVSIPATWTGPPATGKNEGSAGVAFSATRRARAGGQEVRNIVVERYRPLSSASTARDTAATASR